jgi:Zn-finger nucleic acid-binding protein
MISFCWNVVPECAASLHLSTRSWTLVEAQEVSVANAQCGASWVVRGDCRKVATVQGFPVPKDMKAVASYCRRFIPSFSKVAASHFELTNKDQ